MNKRESLELALRPPRPKGLPYTKDPEKLADDSSGECYESFFARLTNHLSPREIKQVQRAYTFSKYGHAMQKRLSGERYFNHVRAVAISIIDELALYDADILCSALLHDIHEDTSLLDHEVIRKVFGKKVMQWLEILTKIDDDDKSYYRKLATCRSWQPILIKCADRLHNIRTLHHKGAEKVMKQIHNTRREFPPLIERLSSTSSKLLRSKAEYLTITLDKALEAQEMHTKK